MNGSLCFCSMDKHYKIIQLVTYSFTFQFTFPSLFFSPHINSQIVFRDFHIIFNLKHLINVCHHIIIIDRTHFKICYPHFWVPDYIFLNNIHKEMSVFGYVHKTQNYPPFTYTFPVIWTLPLKPFLLFH